MNKYAVALSASLLSAAVSAAPVTYNIDATHTYPSFEADHGGMSNWRGKINKNSGVITIDREAKTGTVDVTMDMTSIDFGLDAMNDMAKNRIFETEKFPTATFKGKLAKFNGDAPTEVQGELTLHGVTKPVTLTINSFMCRVNPMSKKEACGADASATINRADYGVNFMQQMGFKMDVKLAIQVEAIKAE